MLLLLLYLKFFPNPALTLLTLLCFSLVRCYQFMGTNWIKHCFAARRYTQLSGQEIWVRLHSVTTRKKLTNGLQQILPKSRCVGTSSRNRPPRQSPLQPFLVNLRNRTGEEKRRQILCDKRDNNFVWNNFSSNFPFLCTDFFVKDQKTLVLCGGER